MPVKKIADTETIESLRQNGSTVYYEKSVTKNMGDYNSAKVTVGITLPIKPTKEEIEYIKDTIEVADEIVTDEIENQVAELLDDK